MGIIEEVAEPTDWYAPMAPIKKRNKDRVQVCVDLKQLTKAVKHERYILPMLEDIAPKLAGTKDQPGCKLTTVITAIGRFYFQRLPFGVTSAPEIFQRQMSPLLKGHEEVVMVMDDILIFGATNEGHDSRLHAVLRTRKDSGLKLNKAKSHFGKFEIQYLYHIISAEGMRPDPNKVKAITHTPGPTNVEELRQVLGLIKDCVK